MYPKMKYINTFCLIFIWSISFTLQEDDFQQDFSNINSEKFNQDMVHNRGHVKEHYKGKANLQVEDMQEGQLEFMYFKEHDYNDDGQLDGLELLKAIQHDMPFFSNEDRLKSLPYMERKRQLMDWHEQWLKQVTVIIDSMFAKDDLNSDGYLSFPEFRKRIPGRRK